MPPSITLHLDPCTVNSRKTLACLLHLRTPHTVHKIDYFAGEHKSPSYIALNPCATVPCAEIDTDLVITESNAIILYAAELASLEAFENGQKDLPAYPKDPKLRADIQRWLFWESSVWFPACYIYLIQNVAQPLLGGTPDEKVLAAQEPRWKELAGILEGRLRAQGEQGCGWLCGRGEEPTIADLVVAASLHLWRRMGLPMGEFGGVGAWMGRVEGLGCWRETQGAVEAVLGGGDKSGG